MSNINADVIRVQDTEANLAANLRQKMIGLGTDAGHRLCAKFTDGTTRHYTCDEDLVSGVVEGAWTDWSSSVVLTGFAGTPFVWFFYKTLGKTLKIRVVIQGTGDGSGVLTFTLPFSANTSLSGIGNDMDKIPAQIQNGDGGFQATPGLAQLSGATSVAVYTDWNGSGWAVSTTKKATISGDIDLA